MEKNAKKSDTGKARMLWKPYKLYQMLVCVIFVWGLVCSANPRGPSLPWTLSSYQLVLELKTAFRSCTELWRVHAALKPPVCSPHHPNSLDPWWPPLMTRQKQHCPFSQSGIYLHFFLIYAKDGTVIFVLWTKCDGDIRACRMIYFY